MVPLALSCFHSLLIHCQLVNTVFRLHQQIQLKSCFNAPPAATLSNLWHTTTTAITTVQLINTAASVVAMDQPSATNILTLLFNNPPSQWALSVCTCSFPLSESHGFNNFTLNTVGGPTLFFAFMNNSFRHDLLICWVNMF